MNPATTARSTLVRRCFAVSRWLPVLLVLCLGGSLQAQNGDLAEAESIQGRLLYRLDDGTVVPLENLLIDPLKIEQVVQWLTTQRNVPGYDTIITASGQVSNGQASIHVDLQIEVHAEDDWVRVPVGFQSWTVQSFQHAPDQPGFESRFAGNASSQREWFLRGKGSHTLSMDLVGEVRDLDAARQRLKLSMPNAVISSLELTFDQPVENVRGNFGDQSPVRTTDEGSTVKFWGLDQETEISWESAAAAGDQTTVITCPEQAEMTLDLTTSTAGLRCTQLISITDGAVEQLSVRLPPGFPYTSITGTDDAGNNVVKSDDVITTDGISTARIVFTKPVRRRVQLDFDLRRVQSGSRQTIFVSVPKVSGVSDQSARVNILIPRGLKVEIPPVPLTQRIRVEPTAGQLSEATAYELLSTDARLRVTVSEQKARFTTRPEIEFSTDDRSLLLLARFPFNVSSGSLDKLTVTWQDFAKDGWQIVPGSVYLNPEQGPRRELSYDIADDSKLNLMLDNFQSGIFSVQLEAFRDLSPADDDEESGSFSLPDVITPRRHETIVSLIESDMFSLSLSSARDGRSFDMIPSQRLVTPDAPGRTTKWLVNESGSRVRVEPSLQTQEVSSSAVVGLDAERDSILVHARIDINVQHRDLPELRFTADDEVQPSLTFSDESTALPLPERDGDEFVWQLPEPIRGQHTVSVRYRWAPRQNKEPVQLPLILPSSGLESLIIGTRIPDVVSVVNDGSIPQIIQEQFEAAWYSEEPLAEVELEIPQNLQRHQPQLPSICLVETQIGPVNVTTTTTLFYESRPDDVLFNVPVSAGIAAAVNDIRVDAVKIELMEMDTGEMRQISVPRSAVENPEDGVTVSLTCQTPRGPHHHLLSRETPAYPRLVRAPEWLTTVWLVSTSENNRLVSLDSNHHSVGNASMTDAWLPASADQMPPAIETALTGLPDSIRRRFQEGFGRSAITQHASLTFVTGPQLQSVPLMIYSRAMGWVLAAGLGILLYTVLVTFRQHLKLILTLMIPVCVLAWGLLPQQTLSLLMPMLPAIIAAVVAWTIRQLLIPSHARRRSRRRRGTVFTATPRPQSASTLTDSLGSAAPVSGAEPAVQ